MSMPGAADPRSDETLVRICNEGDAREAEAAFRSLYDRHRDYVLRVALRFVRDPDTALDALQETFTYLLRKFPPAGDGLRLTARLTTLLYPVARNSAITLARKTARTQAGDGPAPDELAADDAADDRSDVERLLEGLSAQRREVVLLRFVDGLPLAEIAQALDVPLGTVKSRLHHALAELRKSPKVIEFFDP